MNFNHLEYAAAVSKYGSISKASQKLLLSQPYLSGMIKGLEEELGYKIFTRNKSGIELTSRGEQFMKGAKLVLLELKKIKEIADDEIKPLNISCYYATYVMELFLNFRNESAHNVPDKIKEMGNKEVMESVQSGESTLGIIFYIQEKHTEYEIMATEIGLQMKPLFVPMPVYILMSQQHLLATKSGLTLSELSHHSYVAYDDTSSKSFLNYLGLSEHSSVLEVSDRGSFYDALESGKYLSMMAFQHPPEKEGMVIIPLKDRELLLDSSYVMGKNHNLTAREKEFLTFLQGNGKADRSK